MDLATLLTPSAEGGDRFAALSSESDERRTYGGVFIGQAIIAASATVPDAACHSLHLLFLGPGDNRSRTDLAVDRVRDGRSFAARSVRIEQGGALLATGLASFARPGEGFDHQVAMPDVPSPDAIEDQQETRWRNADARSRPRSIYASETMLDMRPHPMPPGLAGEQRRCLWFRARSPLANDPSLHRAAIGFASDAGLVAIGLVAHNASGDERRIDAASLDHAIWFHRDARADDWLLHVEESIVTTHGRGHSRGLIFAPDGRLVASTAQEILARYARA